MKMASFVTKRPPVRGQRGVVEDRRRRWRPGAGGAPRAISSGLLPNGHVFTERRDLLPAEPKDAAKPVGRVEAAHPIAFVDDAAGGARGPAPAAPPAAPPRGRVVERAA